MIKNGKEYRIVEFDNDPEWPCYCSYPHCLADIGGLGLKELTYPDYSKMSLAERCSLSYMETLPTRRFYCLHCLTKMFTEDEIKVLWDERREFLQRKIKQWHDERVENGYVHSYW